LHLLKHKSNMLTKDTAICIRTTDYSETSQVVTFFTRATGKVDAIAKGSKRPKSSFGGSLEIFSYGQIIFTDSNRERLSTLTEFAQQKDFSGLATNHFGLNCAYFAVELTDKLTTDYDPHPELFDSLVEFLQNLQDSKEDVNRFVLLILLQLTLLKEIGLGPILSHCANCKADIEHQAYFSSSANGLVCMDCEGNYQNKIRLSKDAANALSNLRLLPQTQEKTLREIEKVLLHHFTETIGRPPKMAKYFAEHYT
jgi:DNA repair protein RecO (recombination protein O)